MKLRLAAFGLATFSIAAQQQDNGPYDDQDIHLTGYASPAACTVADGISYASEKDRPACAKTLGDWPLWGLVYPEGASSDKCIFVPSTIPHNVDVSRPAFARLTYEQLSGPTNVIGPGGCTANPAACTVFTIQPLYLIDGESILHPQEGHIVVSDFLANQNKPLRFKFTATFRGIANAGNPSRAELTSQYVLMSQHVVPRRPIVWKICRPQTRLNTSGAPINNVASTTGSIS